MTTFFVTTGISLRESSRCWTGLEEWRSATNQQLLDQAHSGNLFETFRNRRADVLRAITDPASANHAVEAQFDPKCWDPIYRHTLPAEMATLLALGAGQIITDEDAVVFLAGKTNFREALLLEAMYRFLQTNGSIPLAAGRVSISNPFVLDPSTDDDFQRGMTPLLDLVASRDAHFVLTGGYKIVLIRLIQELVTLQRSGNLYYIHEHGDRLITLTIEAGQWTSFNSTRC